MRRIGLLAALAAAGLAGPALADDAPEKAVATVVVTATRTPMREDKVGSSVMLVTAAEIETQQWRTLPEALSSTPGLNVFQVGGPGGLTSVFIRGADANHTEVLIDGVEANDPSQNDAYDFGQGLTAGVDRIEILRGPQSSLYGADALGGVVSITTLEGEGPPKFGLSLETGSFATDDESASMRGGPGRLHYAVSLAHFRSGDTPVTPPQLLVPGETAIGDGYDNVTVDGKFGWDLAAHARLGLVLRWVNSTYRLTGENYDVFPAAPDSAQTSQWEKRFAGRLSAHFEAFEGRLKNDAGVSYANDRTVEQSPDEGFGVPAPVLDNGDRLKADWQGDVRLDRRDELVLGVDGKTDRILHSPIDASETRIGGFAELESRPVAGVSLAASVRRDSDDRYGGRTTWRLAGAFDVPGSGTILRASAGTGFKSPTLYELFVSFPAFDFHANPRLRPESSTGYDFGFEQPVAGGRARLGATWFHNSIRDLIQIDPAGTSWANVGRANTYGVESFAAFRPMRTLDLRIDFTWLIARDDIEGKALLRRPKNRLSATVFWRASSRLTLAASEIYVGSWIDGNRDFSIPRLRASPYATLDVSGEYRLGHGLTLFARATNLLDRHYQSPIGFDQPGFGAYGGVQADLP